jgi:Bacterial type II/III secretion system short domain
MKLRFTIRDLLWLTALAAMSVAWWLDHRKLVGDPKTVKYQLNVADANTVAHFLKLMEGASGAGISVDSRDNSVIVTCLPERQPAIREVINKFEGASVKIVPFGAPR